MHRGPGVMDAGSPRRTASVRHEASLCGTSPAEQRAYIVVASWAPHARVNLHRRKIEFTQLNEFRFDTQSLPDPHMSDLIVRARTREPRSAEQDWNNCCSHIGKVERSALVFMSSKPDLSVLDAPLAALFLFCALEWACNPLSVRGFAPVVGGLCREACMWQRAELPPERPLPCS